MQPSISERFNLRKIGIIALVFGLLFIGFLVYREIFTLYIKGTFPSTNRISYASPFIELQFNKTLAEEHEVSIRDGEQFVQKTEIKDKDLIVYVADLQIGVTYTIDIGSITATDGKTITNKTITFTVQDIPFDEMTEREQEAALSVQNEKNEVFNDPILSLVPYSTLEYNLGAVLVGNEERPTLRAELLLTGADVRINREDAIKRYKASVLKYLTDNSLNPKDYEIEYVVIEPNI